MKIIPVRIRNSVEFVEMFVDEVDYKMLLQKKWSISMNGYPTASWRVKSFPNKKKTIHAHKLIMGYKDGLDVDHIDGNKLNNQRSNLRFCSRSQNLMNRGKNKNNGSGYKGVYWKQKSNKWCAQIGRIGGRKTYLGLFETVEEASLAYRDAAKKLHGQYARF